METCQCEPKKNFRWKGTEKVCVTCEKIIESQNSSLENVSGSESHSTDQQPEVAKKPSGQAFSPTIPPLSVSSEKAKSAIGNLISSNNTDVPSEVGINGIIRRMWWWILAQGVIIGFWFVGNSSQPDCHISSLTGSTYCTDVAFDWGSFFLGFLVGVGAFAPLVFIVEAIREVVRAIYKSKDN